LQQQTLKLY